MKLMPLLGTPPTVTTTLPVVAPVGTSTVMLVALQAFAGDGAGVPLKATVLEPWVPPKLLPVIVTGVPFGPMVGEMLLMLGGGVPAAALKAANAAPQLVEEASVAVAEIWPALA